MSQKTKRSDVTNLQVGDYLSEVQYYKVTKINGDRISVANERGFAFEVTSGIVEEGMYSASQFTETKKVSKSEIVEILEGANDTIFTVNFNKLPSEKSITDYLKTVDPADLQDAKALKKIAKQVNQGEERTLVGYKLNSEPKMGRTKVIDMEQQIGTVRSRLVDHRTINWLILKNVKYVAK